jgi:hypothetical protein
MASNHLIIGLGGTGGRVICALRKTLYREFREEYEDIPDVYLDFLYVDSSDSLMDLNHASWKQFGKNLQLGRSHQVLIKGDNLQQRLAQVGAFPGIKSWIGDKETWNTILAGIGNVEKGAAGQKRRLGRFLLSSNIGEFHTALRGRVQEMVNKAALDYITFHVVAGLAGGTGGGSVVDVVGQLHALYGQNFADGRYRVIVYALLPEESPPPKWDTGNYHANGYAALIELNDLMLGQYQPWDISQRERAQRLQLTDPVSSCYIFSTINENGVVVNVETEMPDIIADFLYLKTVGLRGIEWETLRRQENFENGDIEAEKDAHGSKNERGKKFQSFGIKRVAIPNEEIEAYLTYNFAVQASLQLKYNNWSDETGFRDEAANQNFAEYVKQPKQIERWKLSDEHLCLSVPIVVDNTVRKWVTIPHLWNTIMASYASTVKDKEQHTWFDELKLLAARQYDEMFRSMGVVDFYRTKANTDKRDMAKEIRQNMEREFFDAWRNGSYAIHDLVRIMDELLEYMKIRFDKTEERVVSFAEAAKDAQRKVDSNTMEWAKVGWIPGLLGKKRRLFTALEENLKAYYQAKTYEYGWQFAKLLLGEVRNELGDLRGDLHRVQERLSHCLELFQVGVQSRCNEDFNADDLKDIHYKEQVVKFYYPEVVRKTVTRFVRDRKVQEAQTNEVRSELARHVGEQPTFKLMNQRLTEGTLADILESVCERNANVQEELMLNGQDEKLLNVNIIKRLRERFDGNEDELRNFVRKLISHSGCYLMLNQAEIGISLPPMTVPSSRHHVDYTVFIPKSPDESAFVEKMVRHFQNERPAHVDQIHVVECDNRPYELTFVTLTNLFPLRYASLVSTLRKKYDDRMKNDERDVMRRETELHTESPRSMYSNLFIPNQEELEKAIADMQKEAQSYILLARAMGIMNGWENPVTGRHEIALITKDEYGLDKDQILLGNVLRSTHTKVDQNTFTVLKSVVDTQLQNELKHVDERAALKGKIVEDMKVILEEFKGDRTDVEFQSWNGAGRTAIERLN